MMLSDRIEQLINAVLDGEASEHDLRELQAVIENDSDVASKLADRLAEHRLLGHLHQPFDEERFTDAVMNAISSSESSAAEAILDEVFNSSPKVSQPTPSFFPLRSYLDGGQANSIRSMLSITTIAVVLVAAGVWGIVTGLRRDGSEPAAVRDTINAAESVPVATVLLQEDCVWAAGCEFSEGHRVARGRIDLESGTAVMRFDGGAELILIGRSAISLHSATRVLVHLGNVVVRADDGAEGFVVTTPTSEVVDLGTEFAVKVSSQGDTEVHVIDGEVSYRKLDAASELARLLRAGEGVLINQQGQARAIPMNAPRFKEFLRRINPRSHANLLAAYEGFNYSPGILPLERSTVGIGWTGPWRRRLPEERWSPAQDSSPPEFEIVHGQLNVSWPVPGGRLGMLKLPRGNVFYVRPLSDTIDLSTDRVTYFSLMVREMERSDDLKPPHERLRLTFRSSQDYVGDVLSFGHGQRYRPRIQAGEGTLFTSPFVFPAEQTTLWIGKILSREVGEDEVCFRIYGEHEPLDYAEPATWHVVTRAFNSNAKLDRVLLSSTGKSGRIVDELRIGPTWRSVAPISPDAE